MKAGEGPEDKSFSWKSTRNHNTEGEKIEV